MDNSTWLVSNFISNEDLIDAVLGSIHVPGLTSTAPAVPFRGELVIDGAFTAPLPCPEKIDSSKSDESKYKSKESKCTTIAVVKGGDFFAQYKKEADLDPFKFEPLLPLTNEQLVGLSFTGAPSELVVDLRNKGRSDATAYLQLIKGQKDGKAGKDDEP